MQWKQLPWRLISLALLTLVVVLAGIAGQSLYRLRQHHSAKAWMIEQGVNAGDAFGHPLDHSKWEFVRRWSPRVDHSLAIDEDTENPLEVLLRAQSLMDVETVMYRSHTLGAPEVDLLAKLESLEILQLDGSSIKAAPLDELAHLPLRHICLRHTDASDATLEQLARLPHLDSLDIGETDVSEKAIREFASQHPQMDITWSPNLTPRQQQLVQELGSKVIKVQHEYVLHKINAERIAHVNIEQLPLAPAVAVDMLSEVGVVVTLTISSEAVGDDLLKELPRLQRLETLDIAGTEYTMAGLEPLLQLKQLGRISCYDRPNDCTKAAVEAFRKQFRGIFDVQRPCE